MTIITLQELIDRHDLTYAYSDDSRCYRAGQDQYWEIVRLAREIGDLDKAASMFGDKVRRCLAYIDDQARFQRAFVDHLTSPTLRG